MYKSSVPVFLRQTASSHQKRLSQIRPVRQPATVASQDKENKHCYAPMPSLSISDVDQSLSLAQIADYQTCHNVKPPQQVEKSPSIFKEIFQKSSAQRQTSPDQESPVKVA